MNRVFELAEDNRRLKALLAELLPDMEARVQGLLELYPGRHTLTTLHRNEELVRRMKAFVKP